MDLKSGYAWWLIKNGLINDYAPLNSDLETSVIIIGSGITGALAAHFLCEAGISCAIVDKRTIATGSTLASSAQLQYEIDTYLFDLQKKTGIENAVKSYRLCLESIQKLTNIIQKLQLDCDFEAKSSLYLASDKNGLKDLEKEYELRRNHQLPVDFLDEETLKGRFGIHRKGALYNDCSAQVDAYRLTHGLLAYHIKNTGLKVFGHTEITKVLRKSNHIMLTTADGKTIKAEKMVCAPGFESAFFLKEKVMKLNSTYVLVSDPIRETEFWNEQCLIWETARPYLFIRTTKDHRVMIGGEDIPFRNPKLRDKLMEYKNKKLLEKFHKLFPHITIKPAFYWCGTFGETQDGLPYIGEHIKLPHTYFALGYGGNGITFSVIAAEIIRDLYLNKPTGNEKLFAFNR